MVVELALLAPNAETAELGTKPDAEAAEGDEPGDESGKDLERMELIARREIAIAKDTPTSFRKLTCNRPPWARP